MFDDVNMGNVPPWLNPRETPMDMLLKGAEAGSTIARNWSDRARLGLEIEKQQQMLPLQVAETGLQIEGQRIKTAENQIGLDSLNQELDFQNQDLPTFRNYVQSLAGETDLNKRAATPIPAFMSKKFTAQAEGINRAMQDNIAVKEANDARHEYTLAMTEQVRDLMKKAADLQPLLDPEDGPILTPQKDGPPIVNQALMQKASQRQQANKVALMRKQGNSVAVRNTEYVEGLQKIVDDPESAPEEKDSAQRQIESMKAQMRVKEAPAMEFETGPNGENIMKYNGKATVLKNEPSFVDKLTMSTLAKEIVNGNAAINRPGQLEADRTNIRKTVNRSQDALDRLTQKYSGTPAATPTPSKASAMSGARQAQGGYKIGGTYGNLKYLGGDPKDRNSWQNAQ